MDRAAALAAALGIPVRDPIIAGSLTAAEDMIETHLGGGPVPEAIMDLAVVEVAAGLARRTDTLSGGAQYVDPTSTISARGPRDPLATVRPMLAPYTPPGIA